MKEHTSLLASNQLTTKTSSHSRRYNVLTALSKMCNYEQISTKQEVRRRMKFEQSSSYMEDCQTK